MKDPKRSQYRYARSPYRIRIWPEYEAALSTGEVRAARVLIPPGHNAQLDPRPSAALEERNRNIRAIRGLGRREWYKRSGYNNRTMVENAVFRYKTIKGNILSKTEFLKVELRSDGVPSAPEYKE